MTSRVLRRQFPHRALHVNDASHAVIMVTARKLLKKAVAYIFDASAFFKISIVFSHFATVTHGRSCNIASKVSRAHKFSNGCYLIRDSNFGNVCLWSNPLMVFASRIWTSSYTGPLYLSNPNSTH